VHHGFWFIFEITNPDRALITQCGDGGQQLVVAHGGVCHDLRAAFWIGHHSGIHAGNFSKASLTWVAQDVQVMPFTVISVIFLLH
jgi:hypothetical protein